MFILLSELMDQRSGKKLKTNRLASSQIIVVRSRSSKKRKKKLRVRIKKLKIKMAIN